MMEFAARQASPTLVEMSIKTMDGRQQVISATPQELTEIARYAWALAEESHRRANTAKTHGTGLVVGTVLTVTGIEIVPDLLRQELLLLIRDDQRTPFRFALSKHVSADLAAGLIRQARSLGQVGDMPHA